MVDAISFSVPDLSDDEDGATAPSMPEALVNGTADATDKGQEETWSELKKFYKQNAESIERSRSLDLGKGERDPDFQIAMDTFVETTKVVLDGLTALANIHPVLGVAIFAFHGVISLDLTRRENDRKVLAVKLQMQSMMCSMFQMCKLTHAHVGDDEEKKAQRAQLQVLVKTIADEITQCGSDFNYYSGRKTVSKLIKAKLYQRRFADHIETFALRRSELQTVIGAYTASGIDTANITLSFVQTTTTSTEAKVDSILNILQRLESPHDRDVLKFIDENGGPANCVNKDDLLLTLLNKTRQTSEIETLRSGLRQEVQEDLNVALKKNLERFEKLLKVQNQNMERISDQITQVGKTDINLEGKMIKKAVAPTAPIKLKDPELQRIWDQMGLRRSVKAKQFVLTFRDYLITSDQTVPNTPYLPLPAPLPGDPTSGAAGVPNSGSALFAGTPQFPPPTTLHPNGPDDSEEWVLKHIDVAHIQPIIEAMDEDGSGFISVQEANKFALKRPPGMRLLHWIAYWASGWHYNVTDYRKKIYSIMIQMHRMSSKVLLVNRKVVHMYLDNENFFRLESIIRPIKPLPDSVVRDPELTKIADEIAATQEKRLRDNLKTMGYLVQDAEDIALIAGSGRLETWLLPLLFLLLERHLEIFKLAQTTVLHMIELRMHTFALGALLECYDERTARLKDIFQQVYKDTAAQFKNYSYGMFAGSFNWTGVMKPLENSLLLDNDALYYADEDEEKKDSKAETSTEPKKEEPPANASGASVEGESSQNGSTIVESSDAAISQTVNEGKEKPQDSTQDTSKESLAEPSSDGHSHNLDHSILVKGLGPSMELPEIDLGTLPSQDAHPIEGAWVGTYETSTHRFIYPAFQFFITSIADGKVEASGRYFTHKWQSEGTFDGETNTIDVKLDCGNYPKRRLVGEFDAERNVVEGRWVTVSKAGELPSPYEVGEDDNNHYSGAFKLTRYTPSAFRFRNLLKVLPKQDAPVSLARRRWAFAIEAVRFDVQQHMGSWNYLRARLEERNGWVELSMRDMLEVVFDSTRGFTSPEQSRQFIELMAVLHPSILSVYEAMSVYLFDRFWYNVGLVYCDSCGQRVVFGRYVCITCFEEDYSNALDFCVEHRCADTLTQFDRRDFVHSFSHTLMRTTQRLLGYEVPFLLTVSRLRSERVKRSFREQEAANAGVDPNLQKIVSNTTTETELVGRPSVTALICCACNKDLTLPCWACASCDVDLLFCMECEKTKRPPSKKTKHARDHHMLRITDSVEAKVIKLNTNNKNMEDMEARINDRINLGLEKLEAKVLNESQSRIAQLETKLTGQITSLESKVEMLVQLLQSMTLNKSSQ